VELEIMLFETSEQDLRGVRANGPFTSNNGVFRLRQHGTPFIFFIKILHCVQNFYEKE